MPRSRKAFHFDLSVKELEANGAPKNAWTKIGKYLERNGFEHIQGSGYESTHTMSHQDVNLILEQMQDEFPWFVSCAKDAKVSSIVGKNHDALSHLKQYVSDQRSDMAPPPKEEDSEIVSLAAEVADMRKTSSQHASQKAHVPQKNHPKEH